MKFEIGDVVSHKKSYNRFYVILEDYKNGQYLVEDYEDNFFGIRETHVFVGKYLITKSDRRDYLLDDILKK